MSLEDRLSKFYSPAPFIFGEHPDFGENFRRHQEKRRNLVGRYVEKERLDEMFEGKKISLSDLTDPRHPEVFVIPRDSYIYVVDECDEAIGFERIVFPFSSTDFYVDIDKEGLFNELCRSEAFSRLGNVTQLGYLVPPRPEEWDENLSIAYTLPQFRHTRWIHSLLAAILTELILARNGFSREERVSMVLTAGCHDIALPAGGDSVKRVDPENLSEEKNFSWLLEYRGLAKCWTKKFGFKLKLAQDWVEGKGVFGQLLDTIDKICYTALDCYQIGLIRQGQIRNLCLQHPLVMDVWQDILFTPCHTSFAFSQPERLFWFLLLRAYEYQELIFNPYSRALDLFLKKLVQPLYKEGLITREQLLTHDDVWLHQVLSECYPQKIKWYIEPEKLSWKKFETAKEQKRFCAELNSGVEHIEYITGITSGLDFLVFDQEKIVPLRQVISKDKIELIEEVVASTRGYYVYYQV